MFFRESLFNYHWTQVWRRAPDSPILGQKKNIFLPDIKWRGWIWLFIFVRRAAHTTSIENGDDRQKKKKNDDGENADQNELKGKRLWNKRNLKINNTVMIRLPDIQKRDFSVCLSSCPIFEWHPKKSKNLNKSLIFWMPFKCWTISLFGSKISNYEWVSYNYC